MEDIKRKNISILLHKTCVCYVYLMTIYLSFETPILNVLPLGTLIYVRYGIEVIGYFLLLLLILIRANSIYVSSEIKSILIFAIILGASIIANAVQSKIAILGIRWIVRYIYIFLICFLGKWREKDISKFLELLHGIMLIEVALGGLQLVARNTMDNYLLPQYGTLIDGIEGYSLQGQSKYAIYASFGRYGEFGYFIMFAIWLWIAEIIYSDSSKRKKQSCIMIAIWGILLVFSYCRQEMVAIVISIIMFLVDYEKMKLKIKHVIVIVSVLIIIVPSSIVFLSDFEMGQGTIYEGVTQRFLSIFSLDFVKADYYGKGRTWFYTVAASRLLSHKPILGFGVGRYACQTAIQYDSAVHRMLDIPTTFSMDVYYVSILGQIGIVGVITMLNMYLKLIKRSKNVFNYANNDTNLKKYAVITYGYVMCGLITAFFSSSLSDRYLAFYLWSTAGIFTNMCFQNKNVIHNDDN